ncbi:MAG: NYN domain-containing protein [Pseudomonadota bacterium]
MAFYKDERLALFIDGTNVYSTARNLSLEIDFRKVLDEFRTKGRLLRANYYTALVENDDYSPIRPLVDWLAYNGFNVITKTAKEYTDREGRRRVRGNMSTDMAVDMIALAPHLDHLVLFSGDGDFKRAVEHVKSLGVRVTVISSVKSQPPMISDELRREADSFIDLNDMSERIARPRRENDREEMYDEED